MIWPERLAQLDAYVLSHITQRAHRLLCDHLDTTGLRMQHYRVLAGLGELGQCSQATLGRALAFDAGTLVLVLDDLEKRGAVVREPDPASRRRNVVRATADGLALLHEMDLVVKQANNELLAPLTGPERATLHALLAKLVEYESVSQRVIESAR